MSDDAYEKYIQHRYPPMTLPAQVQGIKIDEGKAPVDLIDPDFLFGIGRVLGKGAKKYAVDNWKHGMAVGKVLAGVLRHVFYRLKGEVWDACDPNCPGDCKVHTNEMHMHCAACGLMFVAYYDTRKMDNVPDDRFKKETP